MEAPLVGSTQGVDRIRTIAGGFEFRLTDYGGGTSLPFHRHERAKLSTVIRGAYTETYAGKTLECESGMLLMKPPETGHADCYPTLSTVLTIDFHPQVFDSVIAGTRLFRRAEQARLRSPLVGRIMTELRAPDSLSVLALEGLAMQLVATVGRLDASHRADHATFARACEYLDAHLSEPPHLSELATASGVPVTELARLFRKYAGCSPGHWMRARRMEEAKHRLISRDAPLAEVALSLGFYDQSHFINAFRREAGMTPAQFRRAHRRPTA